MSGVKLANALKPIAIIGMRLNAPFGSRNAVIWAINVDTFTRKLVGILRGRLLLILLEDRRRRKLLLVVLLILLLLMLTPVLVFLVLLDADKILEMVLQTEVGV